MKITSFRLSPCFRGPRRRHFGNKTMGLKTLASRCGAFIAVGLMLCGARVANASIIVADLGGGQTQVTIDPVTFTVTQIARAAFLVFEDFWAVDSTVSGVAVSSTMSYTINGGTPVSPAQTNISGRIDSTIDEIDPNDLIFIFNNVPDPTLNIGDIFVISGSFVFSGNADGIASNSGPYDTTLLGPSCCIQILGTTTVAGTRLPEPGTLAILGLGLVGLSLARRRKTA